VRASPTLVLGHFADRVCCRYLTDSPESAYPVGAIPSATGNDYLDRLMRDINLPPSASHNTELLLEESGDPLYRSQTQGSSESLSDDHISIAETHPVTFRTGFGRLFGQKTSIVESIATDTDEDIDADDVPNSSTHNNLGNILEIETLDAETGKWRREHPRNRRRRTSSLSLSSLSSSSSGTIDLRKKKTASFTVGPRPWVERLFFGRPKKPIEVHKGRGRRPARPTDGST
jgi:hypothetical protein